MNFTNPGREKELISSNVHLFYLIWFQHGIPEVLHNIYTKYCNEGICLTQKIRYLSIYCEIINVILDDPENTILSVTQLEDKRTTYGVDWIFISRDIVTCVTHVLERDSSLGPICTICYEILRALLDKLPACYPLLKDTVTGLIKVLTLDTTRIPTVSFIII